MSGRPRVFSAGLILSTIALGLSCAPSGQRFSKSSTDTETILGVEHLRSRKPADCLASCVDMMLHYYGIEAVLPDTSLPLEMISLAQQLNAMALTDSHGYKLFAAAQELAPAEMVAHLMEERPLILIYKPRAQQVYHSVVISGYSPERDSFYANDPLRTRPSWIRMTKIPMFEHTGKYLILLIALHGS